MNTWHLNLVKFYIYTYEHGVYLNLGFELQLSLCSRISLIKLRQYSETLLDYLQLIQIRNYSCNMIGSDLIRCLRIYIGMKNDHWKHLVYR